MSGSSRFTKPGSWLSRSQTSLPNMTLLLDQIRASNARLTEATTPRTAVFVGATDGIGKRALLDLVSTGFPLKAYIIGRHEARDQLLLEELHTVNKNAELIYLEGQVSLMSEVKRLTDVILGKEQAIDLLYHSAGFLPFQGHQETTEGFELSFAVAHYSRFAFISRLLPKLQAAVKTGPGHYRPRVISILAAGYESADLFLNDLTLKEPGRFSIPAYARHVATMVTISMKRFAEQSENQSIVFVHAHPGRVATELLKKSWGDKWDPSAPPAAAPSAGNFDRFTLEEAGQKALYLMTSAEYGGTGVGISKERSAASTLTHQTGGSLFSVNDKMEYLQQDSLLSALEAGGAVEAIWHHSEETLAPWF
ncbi:Short chain dehydrogenase reductase family protein [Colletotrichum higginsianum IMI 349063]|uniref:Short chain dehydrogenase reductase family protein n=3 Tax=Colletotrichum higginsianum TaxID=80884 RepID=A0A1B7XZU4_COLHI|nr:Short chain dehydrogenase reductase family protein [Colletotrichum higginsianum IMI 349063]OBR05276.1 Short chain dehydrogenase reductase family protein [Colletotrichum higginsianum IMI 349063]